MPLPIPIHSDKGITLKRAHLHIHYVMVTQPLFAPFLAGCRCITSPNALPLLRYKLHLYSIHKASLGSAHENCGGTSTKLTLFFFDNPNSTQSIVKIKT